MQEPVQRAAGRAVRGAAIVLVSSYLNMGMGFAATVWLTRLLAPEDFGVLALATFLFGLLDPRTKFGLDPAFMHRPRTTDQLIATHLSLQLALGVGGLLLALLVRPLLPLLGYSPQVAVVVVVLAAVGILEVSGTTARNVLEKDLRFGRTALVVSGSWFFCYATSITLAGRGLGLWSLVAGSAVNFALNALGFWALAGVRLRPTVDRAMARWLLRFGTALVPGAFAVIFLTQFDNFLVGTLVGLAALGYYERAYKVAQWPTGLVTHVVARVSLPFYARLQHDPPRLARAFGLTLWLIAAVAVPLALVLFAVAPDFVRLVFGEKWLPSALYLRLLVVYSAVRPLLDDAAALFAATGQPRKVTSVQVSQAVALVAAATPLTWLWGAPGTALGVGVAFVVGLAVTYRYVWQTVHLPLWETLRGPALGTAAGVAALAALALASESLAGWPLWARVVGQGGVVALAFYGGLALVEGRDLWTRGQYIWRLAQGSRPEEMDV
ncbi:MAG: oligosaccharide flippase family protein [Chloroflexi bacterium]|nr:oligosaccharide flippase family protein [Chloroflexota bacterium]